LSAEIRRNQAIAEEACGQRIDQRKDRDRQHDAYGRSDEDVLDRIIPHHGAEGSLRSAS
jgi:hypothetical protein